MITLLRGTLLEKRINRAVIDVAGVGYEVHIPLSTYDKLPKEGGDVTIRTILHVREDLMQLYGFMTEDERNLYMMVSSVSGIGPKIALNVLSCMSVESFCANVVNKDVKALSSISGVGKRTAERLVVELKGKVQEIAPAIAITGRAPSGDSPEAAEVSAALSTAAEDAVAGLVTLGIKADAARKTIREVIDQNEGQELTSQKLIRLALSNVNS